MTTNATVAQKLAAALQRHGVTHVFGQSIPSLFHLCAPDFAIRQIGYRTENAGGAMADGYARISRKIGVVSAQNGPAATLLVAPLAEAYVAGVPLLALVEEVPASDMGKSAFQEFDHAKLFQSCAKAILRIDCASRVDEYVDMAMVCALSGKPGPVVLLAPRDVMAATAAGAQARAQTHGAFPLDRMIPEPDKVREAADKIASARRPLLIAGGGVHLSGAQDAVAALSALASIPVATTNMGKGSVSERDPMSLGVFGNCMGEGSYASHLRRYVTDADLIILVGTRTNQNGTDAWTLYPHEAEYMHIDVNSAEISRNYESLRLAGDARATLEALIGELRMRDLDGRAAYREEIAQATASAREKVQASLDKIGPGAAGAVRPEYMMRTLDALLQPDDIVVADASYATNWMATYLTAQKPGARFVSPRGLAGLGWGFPMALGAKAAQPQSRVVAIVGDGGFAHCWSELETARRMKLPVTLIVLNNQILGYQTHGENAFFGAHSDACELGQVDHAQIARACGCHGERVTSPEEFGLALERALASDRPALLDVLVDAKAHPPLNAFEGRDTSGPVRRLEEHS